MNKCPLGRRGIGDIDERYDMYQAVIREYNRKKELFNNKQRFSRFVEKSIERNLIARTDGGFRSFVTGKWCSEENLRRWEYSKGWKLITDPYSNYYDSTVGNVGSRQNALWCRPWNEELVRKIHNTKSDEGIGEVKCADKETFMRNNQLQQLGVTPDLQLLSNSITENSIQAFFKSYTEVDKLLTWIDCATDRVRELTANPNS